MERNIRSWGNIDVVPYETMLNPPNIRPDIDPGVRPPTPLEGFWVLVQDMDSDDKRIDLLSRILDFCEKKIRPAELAPIRDDIVLFRKFKSSGRPDRMRRQMEIRREEIYAEIRKRTDESKRRELLVFDIGRNLLIPDKLKITVGTITRLLNELVPDDLYVEFIPVALQILKEEI